MAFQLTSLVFRRFPPSSGESAVVSDWTEMASIWVSALCCPLVTAFYISACIRNNSNNHNRCIYCLLATA